MRADRRQGDTRTPVPLHAEQSTTDHRQSRPTPPRLSDPGPTVRPVTVDHLASLRQGTAALAELLARADLTVPVPSCPGWSLAELGRHTGAVHHWARAALSTDGPRTAPGSRRRPRRPGRLRRRGHCSAGRPGHHPGRPAVLDAGPRRPHRGVLGPSAGARGRAAPLGRAGGAAPAGLHRPRHGPGRHRRGAGHVPAAAGPAGPAPGHRGRRPPGAGRVRRGPAGRLRGPRGRPGGRRRRAGRGPAAPALAADRRVRRPAAAAGRPGRRRRHPGPAADP
ncbi:maleylpyruvate isomerase N-terminal domain-containing protein [Klenkia terrae]|uniref:maleylpyruvate isomerase N-terminal domain-containing protein n=1 Tax=Klenkia terrae TaxID=1052259 RepID=UPI00360D009F